jgi:histidine triad (HIT) family protein
MHNHTPSEYICPICLGVEGVENKHTLLLQQDLVYQDKQVSAFINSFRRKNNPGHVIIVPNKHYENIYDLPDELAGHITQLAKKVALAMKEVYSCDGITTLQNNEPAGDQHAFHYHFHVFPRFEGDDFNVHAGSKILSDPADRLDYATRLRQSLS